MPVLKRALPCVRGLRLPQCDSLASFIFRWLAPLDHAGFLCPGIADILHLLYLNLGAGNRIFSSAQMFLETFLGRDLAGATPV